MSSTPSTLFSSSLSSSFSPSTPSSSSSSTPAATTTDSGHGTEQPGQQPPLLPAFLITGLLLAAIIFIIIWRNMMERRADSDDDGDDPTFAPRNEILEKSRRPVLWEPRLESGVSMGKVGGEPTSSLSWRDMLPLSATLERTEANNRRPWYLIPLDRPVTFFTRMFGSERREPRVELPMSVFTRNMSRAGQGEGYSGNGGAGGDGDGTGRVHVVVLIAMPRPGGERIGEEMEKGKNKSLDGVEWADEDNPMEFAFGTAVPYVGKG